MRYKRPLSLGLVALAFALACLALLTADAAPSSAPGTVAPAAGTAAPAESGSHVVRIYYFHNSVRCVSCRKIEALTNQAIDAAFTKEIKDGKVAWEVVDIDEPPNQHFVKDYGLYTKSVVVVDSENGKQVRWKNLEKVWPLLQNDQAFIRYIQDEIRGYLEGRS